MNPFPEFLTALFDSGQLRMSPPQPMTRADLHAGIAIVEEFEPTFRDQLAWTPPRLDSSALAWATQSFFRAAQFTIYREIEEQDVLATFRQLDDAFSFESKTDSAHYSVDLVFRFLPQLWKLTNAMNRDDPVGDTLRQWAFAWPLSSVGMELKAESVPINIDDNETNSTNGPVAESMTAAESNTAEATTTRFDIAPFSQNKCLMQLYVDRIIQSGDKTRVDDPQVVEKIKQSVGIHNEMAGWLLQV